MKALRIVFMGTPEFAVASLDRLIQAGYNVVGVVTAPDRPAGRGRKLQQSAIKQYAVENELPLLQPDRLKNNTFLEDLKNLQANIQVVVAFRMLPREVWDMPEYGTFNLHASLLPQYRGAAPINWVLINGETETGVTTFFIDDQIDTGAILLQEKTAIGPDETAGELHDRLMDLGSELVLQTVEKIEMNTPTAHPQTENQELKKAPKIHKETCRINWEHPIAAIYNHIRGLSPYPAAWTVMRNGETTQEIKVYRVHPEFEEHQLPAGKILVGKEAMKVAVPGGYIRLLELQLAGKRRLKVLEVLNGLHLEKNAHMV